jgi:site-specific recombinase XerD
MVVPMPITSGGSDRWSLLVPDPDLVVPVSLDPVLERWSDLAERERRAMVAGELILLRPDLSIDRRIQRYFRSLEFEALAVSSRQTYATELKTWLDFLLVQGVGWDAATEEDFAWFKKWRLDPAGREGNRRPVQAASWDKGVAALDHFYRWAANPKRAYVVASPLPTSGAAHGDRHRAARNRALSGNARQDRARWVVPLTARFYRDVGLRGYTVEVDAGAGRFHAGVVAGSFRCRNSARNCAFFDLTYSTALRRSEAGSLLVAEVPAADAEVRLAAAASKGGGGRHYVAQGPALAAVHAYIRLGRSQAVRRARRAGRYDGLPILHVERVEQRRRAGLTFVLEDGSALSADRLTPVERGRLFADTGEGWEPMSLWLAEDGLPMDRKSWGDVFDAANKRLAREMTRAGANPADVPVLSPHSLRSSFALWVLAALHRSIDQQSAVEPTAPYDERRYVAAFEIVQDLLGHASVETTRKYYLEPVKGVRRAVWLEHASDIHEVLSSLAMLDDRVVDIAGA